MNVIDCNKERLFTKLDNCLNALRIYDINSLMPLLYVVVAHNEGHLLSIIGEPGHFFSGKMHIQSVEAIDGNESELLKEIRQSVDSHYFEGQPAEIVYRFYETCNDFIKDYYQDIIEHIISHYSSRGAKYGNVAVTPREVANLMAKMIEGCHPSKIYDPCAGLCSYSLLNGLKDIPLIGQENNPLTKILAEIRLDAAKKSAILFKEDSTLDWRGNDGCDVLASELPFGLRLYDSSTDRNRPQFLEDFVLYKFIKTQSLKKAVLMVSMATCSRRANFDIRKTLCDKNLVEAVIKLPAGILPYTGINTAIIVLNKERKTKDIKFVLADDCINNDGSKRLLDYQSVLDRIVGTDDKQCASVLQGTTFDNNCTLDPSAYITERIEVLPGQKIVKFSSLAIKERGIRRFEETKGRVLKPEHMCASIAEMHTRTISIDEVELTKSAYVKICSKVIIFNVRADRFYIKTDEDTLFVSPNYSCFTILEDKCLPEYLADCVVNSKQIKEYMAKPNHMPRLDYLNHLLLPIYDNLESQKQIVQRIYRQEQNELKKKLESLQVLSGKSSDLIHNLGITFTKISAGIGQLLKDYPNETVEGLNDNVQFALRQINCTGTDFAYVQPELEKVNLYESLSNYVKGWSNFGYKTFDVLPIKMDVSEDTKVEIDTTLFYTLLDCIFINAHQHGFNKKENSDNKVLIEIEGVTYNDENYICVGISNNGNSLPDKFTIQDFVARGVVGINSSQDGIGGDHICKIVSHFGGLVSIDNDSEWLTFNILLPVYLTSNETKFNEYECECVSCNLG